MARVQTLQEIQCKALGGNEEDDPLEFVTEFFREKIRKYSLGQEIWYSVTFEHMDVPRPTPDGTVIPYSVPLIKCILGTNGTILGRDNYVWYIIGLPIPGTDEEIDRLVLQAIENLRQQKAQQLNGLSGLSKRGGPTMPLPKRPPGEQQ